MVGIGYDIHRLGDGLPLKIGGIQIPSDRGAIAHSDGDVLLHALCDALLGAAALGDIGEWFPDTDARWKGADSTELLAIVLQKIRASHFQIVNIDATIILEKPKLAAYKEHIRENLASLCKLPKERVSVKATTNEKLDSLGRAEAIAALVICQLEKISS